MVFFPGMSLDEAMNTTYAQRDIMFRVYKKYNK